MFCFVLNEAGEATVRPKGGGAVLRTRHVIYSSRELTEEKPNFLKPLKICLLAGCGGAHLQPQHCGGEEDDHGSEVHLGCIQIIG